VAKLNCVLYKRILRGEVGKVFWYPDEMLLVERKESGGGMKRSWIENWM